MSFVCIMRPKVTMSIYNTTVFMPSEFTLIGIPGLESVQCWVGIPFCAMYLMAMIGNSLLLIIIKSEHSLHQPMYIFLGMLGVTDIALSTSIVPKMLGIFWFHVPEIHFDCCLLQMWLIHTFQGIESGILLTMALDRYVAICYPLRHAAIFSHQPCLFPCSFRFILSDSACVSPPPRSPLLTPFPGWLWHPCL